MSLAVAAVGVARFPRAIIDAEVEKRVKVDRDTRESEHGYRVRHITRERDRLKDAIEKFRAASGISLHDEWMSGQIGEAVRFVLYGNVDGVRRNLERLRRGAADVVAAIDGALAAPAGAEP